MNTLFASWLMWQGLFLGVEHTANWQTPFKQPGITASATALVSVGKFNVRAVYIQPLQKSGFGPAVQVGVNVKVFWVTAKEATILSLIAEHPTSPVVKRLVTMLESQEAKTLVSKILKDSV